MKRVLKRDVGSVHIWRHTALTQMLQKGADIETVRKLAGHSSLVITQRYCHSSDVLMLQAMSQVQPSIGGMLPLGGTVEEKPAKNLRAT